jgi:hypothetical protein
MKTRWTLKAMAKATPTRGKFAIQRDGKTVGIAVYEDHGVTFRKSAATGMTAAGFQERAQKLWERDGEHAMAMVRADFRRREREEAEAREAERRLKVGGLAHVPITVEAQAPARTEPETPEEATHRLAVEYAERPLTAREIQCLKFAFEQGGDGCHVRAFEVKGFGDKLLAWLTAKGFFEMREDPPRLKLTARGINAAVEHTPLKG